MQRHLVIMARAPRLGTVKKRLARDLGALAAWRFHREATRSLLTRLSPDRRWTCWLAVTPDLWASNRRKAGLWNPPGPVRLIGQGRGDLGQRMERVFANLPPGPLVMIGADIPGIAARHVAAAFRALGRHQAVLGPADDGGYYLIGLTRRPRYRSPVAGVRWGGQHALADTWANLERQGASLALLEELQDIDTGADLERWRRR
jgi:rSAM/selenodomain-associated transferase 1